LVLKTVNTKGIHYFDTNYHRSHVWYRSHFPTTFKRKHAEKNFGGRVVVGEASPYYLFHPLAAVRAAAEVPDVRILLILRDPIDRAFSHYRERRREGAEKIPTFEEALAAEADRLAGEEERICRDPGYLSHAHEQQSYRKQGEYALALTRWLEHFPRERVLAVAAEDFYAAPQTTCDTIFAFLGLPPALVSTSHAWNAAPAASLLPETRATLAEYYAPFNRELERLLGQVFPWTKPGSTPAKTSVESTAAPSRKT
jgi:hypothetical protein